MIPAPSLRHHFGGSIRHDPADAFDALLEVSRADLDTLESGVVAVGV